MNLLFRIIAFFLFANSVNAQENYLLTTKGEKINVGEGKVYNMGYKKISYPKYKNPDEKKAKKVLNFIVGDGKEELKTKNVSKIVINEELHLTYLNKKKHQLFRQIAKNESYILGHEKFIIDYANGSGKWRVKTIDNYVILDHDFNLIEGGELFDKKGDFDKNSIQTIKKSFPNCLSDDIFSRITFFQTNQLNCN